MGNNCVRRWWAHEPQLVTNAANTHTHTLAKAFAVEKLNEPCICLPIRWYCYMRVIYDMLDAHFVDPAAHIWKQTFSLSLSSISHSQNTKRHKKNHLFNPE